MRAGRLRLLLAHGVFVAMVGVSGSGGHIGLFASTPSLPLGSSSERGAPPPSAALVLPNDNTHAAGTLREGTLTLALRAGRGRWQPEGPTGPALEIEAFGEVGRPLTVPAPLIRVVQGTAIVASIRNDLDTSLVVHGLCARDGSRCPPVQVPPRDTREVRFASGPAGTYHYWASTLGAPVPFRELAGAFVVDDAETPREPDRILVITEWSDLTAQQLRDVVTADVPTETFVRLKPRLTFVINGLSWPATERFTYHLGQPVRWRVVNLSSQAHPMHLHGFHFEVHSLGDGLRDSVFDERHRRLVVTQLLQPGGTMTMTWRPERAGNWLFHCHIMHHVSVARRLGDARTHAHHSANGHGMHGNDDASLGMAGMVIGVTVRERADAAAPQPSDSTPPRRLTLVMQPAPGGTSELPAAGFELLEANGTAGTTGATAPGPPIVLRRDELVEITLVNRLEEATAIHWHGMELDSYYDGVHGWSGLGRRVTPMIEPGGSFAVRFTPPRAGTFIYHTHLHDHRQLSSGLYGPLIVVDKDEPFDAATDHVIVLGRHGLTSEEPSVLTAPDSVVINGQRDARLVWKAGTRHRVRLINITPDDIFSVSLQTSEGPVVWRPLSKDGAPVPAAESAPGPARQTIAVGETYEFEYEADRGRRTLWLEVRTPGGKWQAQARVIVR